VHANAASRRLNTIDATCPLVTTVHVQARYANGYTVLLIGHEGHEEVVGTIARPPIRSSSSIRRGRRAAELPDSDWPT
jgi:4-hydroxy-3-methylbut-2-enyl diphosphate reductase